jgi:sugar/nucleoside kinase (ribokinase family)
MNEADNFDVLCVGLIVADHVCQPIENIPAPGMLIMTPGLSLTIGGSAANAAVDMVKLGLRAAVVGRVGDDVLGRFVRDALQHEGVCCDPIVVSQTTQTAATLIVNVKGEDRRFIHAVGANVELTGLEVTDELLGRTRAIAVGGFGLNPALSGENVATLFEKARARGVLTLLDVVVGSEPKAMLPMLERALPFTDYFLPNEDESRLITGLLSAADQARRFHALGASHVIVTRGPQGSMICDADGLREHPPCKATQIDGTGGGDAFLAGLLFGLLRGEQLTACLNYASANGAKCVEAIGATTGVMTQTEMLRLSN